MPNAHNHKSMKFLVTGAAGFIGMHVAERLLARGDMVVGVDNLNDYYDVRLKHARLARLEKSEAFSSKIFDVDDDQTLDKLFSSERFDAVIHLAAQAGVRYSLQNPRVYIKSNISGFLNILEACRANAIGHLVYASSSSVYGGNTAVPFSETQNVDHPVSLYAATKKSNELMAHSYSHLFGIPTTGLRFFTVYGPWGRPDMALFLFTSAILQGRPVDLFNHGRMQRDFTYIDDIVEGVVRVLDRPPTANEGFDRAQPDPSGSWAPYRVLNIGNHNPAELLDYLGALEECLGRRAERRLLPMQAGDVERTFANTALLEKVTGFEPKTSIREGIAKFVAWYLQHYALPRSEEEISLTKLQEHT